MPLIFWFDLFFEAKAEILEKNFFVFLEDLKTPKENFKIIWPLGEILKTIGRQGDQINL